MKAATPAAHGREEVLASEGGGHPRRLEDVPEHPLRTRDREQDAVVGERLAQLQQHVDRGGVDVRDRLRVQHQPPRFGARAGDELEHLLAEVQGIREEDGRVEPVDDEARDRLRGRRPLDVVVAVDVLELPQHRVVRADGAIDEDADRDGDGDDDPVEDAEDDDAGERGDGEQELGVSDAAELPHSVHVDQPDRGRHDHDAEHELRQPLDQRHRERGHHRDQAGCAERDEARAAAGLVGQRRPRPARSHRHRAGEACGELRGREAGQFLVRVDLVAALPCEGAADRDRVAEPDEREPHRGQGEVADVGERGLRPRDVRESRRDVADGRDPVRLQAERDGEQTSDHDDAERTGKARQVDPQEEREREQPGAERGRRPARVRHLVDELADPLRKALCRDRQPEHLPQLAGDDQHGGAVDVAEQHRLREEVRHEAETEQRRHEEDDADHQREQRRQLQIARGLRGRERRQRGRRQRRERALRADDRLPRRAEERVDRERQQRPVDADDGRDAREAGHPETRRNRDRGDAEGRQQVDAQPGAVVATELHDPRREIQEHGRADAAGRRDRMRERGEETRRLTPSSLLVPSVAAHGPYDLRMFRFSAVNSSSVRTPCSRSSASR